MRKSLKIFKDSLLPFKNPLSFKDKKVAKIIFILLLECLVDLDCRLGIELIEILLDLSGSINLKVGIKPKLRGIF